ncbi:hypothetical protein IWX49DRAFT_293413 [Phyllosticta citricarpa]|uniref:Uncharacterized protein n=1 Tax=Phyllosticta citricarpa TaxID=55181 RepID=A0ABR1MJL4_9PEZI
MTRSAHILQSYTLLQFVFPFPLRSSDIVPKVSNIFRASGRLRVRMDRSDDFLVIEIELPAVPCMSRAKSFVCKLVLRWGGYHWYWDRDPEPESTGPGDCATRTGKGLPSALKYGVGISNILTCTCGWRSVCGSLHASVKAVARGFGSHAAPHSLGRRRIFTLLAR